jgi:hypothetical protein
MREVTRKCSAAASEIFPGSGLMFVRKARKFSERPWYATTVLAVQVF